MGLAQERSAGDLYIGLDVRPGGCLREIWQAGPWSVVRCKTQPRTTDDGHETINLALVVFLRATLYSACQIFNHAKQDASQKFGGSSGTPQEQHCLRTARCQLF